MLKKLLIISFLLVAPQANSQGLSAWQPVEDIDSLNGIVIRLHQELEAIKSVAREAKKYDNHGSTNFDHKDFIKAVEILQLELDKAIKTQRLIND